MFPTFKVLATTAATLALIGCTNMDGTMNQPANGALIGGLTGGVLGNAIGHSDTSTAIGVAVGAVVGGSIGTQLATQQAELNRSLAGSGAQVVNDGSQIHVILPENVTFPTGSAVVNAGFYGALAAVARNLTDHPNSTIQVVGHTDNVGTAAYNNDLSLRRALAVSEILIRNGLATSRIRYMGQGYYQPIATNTTSAGRAMNRRVEIIIIPTR